MLKSSGFPSDKKRNEIERLFVLFRLYISTIFCGCCVALPTEATHILSQKDYRRKRPCFGSLLGQLQSVP